MRITLRGLAYFLVGWFLIAMIMVLWTFGTAKACPTCYPDYPGGQEQSMTTTINTGATSSSSSESASSSDSFSSSQIGDVTVNLTTIPSNTGTGNVTVQTAAVPSQTTMEHRGVRPLPGMPVVRYPYLPNIPQDEVGQVLGEEVLYSGSTNPGPWFVKVSTMLMYKKYWSVADLKAQVKGTDLWSDDFSLIDDGGILFVTTQVLNKEVAQTGSDIEITDKGATSWELLGCMGLRARLSGADVVHLTKQGVRRRHYVKGGGGGAFFGGSILSGSENAGGSAGFGPGYSSGSTWRYDAPFLGGIYLKVVE